MNYGCGSSVGHSVNALIFAQFNNPESFLGEKSEVRYQEWLHDSKMFLNFVTKFDIDFQNANAYSNLASIHIDEGEFAEAQKCVTAGLHILETANPNKSVSLLWDSNPKAILPIKLELMMHQVSIYMEKGEKSQANKLAKEIVGIAHENDYDDGNVLAASYVLSQSDTGKPRN
jgi:tetratricopeptide (TPR) repeat protein